MAANMKPAGLHLGALTTLAGGAESEILQWIGVIISFPD